MVLHITNNHHTFLEINRNSRDQFKAIKILLNVNNCSRLHLLNKSVSSAYCKWVIEIPPVIEKPSNLRIVTTLSIKRLNSFGTMLERNGDNGSPYPNPLCILISSYWTTLTNNNGEAIDTHSIIHSIHLLLKPILLSINCKKSDLIETYAFLKSTLNSTYNAS